MRCLISALILASIAIGPAAAQETWAGPFSNWRNAKTFYHAMGDGLADDTAALQQALNELRPGNRPYQTFYLPAGVYRITATLQLPRDSDPESYCIGIVGEDPATTRILWDGPGGQPIFLYNASQSRVGRLTLDGQNRASIGIRHGVNFSTKNEFFDMTFRDLVTGIEAGQWAYKGVAETVVTRCSFLRCGTGVNINNYNSLDWWFWNCLFDGCGNGVYNTGGNFTMSQSVFRNSTVADLQIENTGTFGFYDNVSIGSKTFLITANMSAACPLTMQRNTILDPTNTVAVQVDNAGPVLMIDNVIRSKAGTASGPVVRNEGWDCEFMFVGNTFSVSKPYGMQDTTQPRFINEKIVNASAIPSLDPPAPTAPPNATGPVTEMAAGASAVEIQQAINDAAKLAGQHPVVHLPKGRYIMDRTLVIPAGSDLQLVGDGLLDTTVLSWNGEGGAPVLRIQGPTRAVVQDLMIDGHDRADGMLILGCDQSGSRIRLNQTLALRHAQVGFFVNKMRRGLVELCNIGYGNCEQAGVRVYGLGEGKGCTPVAVYNASSSNNNLTYDVDQGGSLLIRNAWYETDAPEYAGFMNLKGSGAFTLQGGVIAHPRLPDAPGMTIDGFRGAASFLAGKMVATETTQIDPPEPGLVIKNTTTAAASVAMLGSVRQGSHFLTNASVGALVGEIQNLLWGIDGKGSPVADRGQTGDAFVLGMLQQTRGAGALSWDPTPAGLADLRLSRIGLANTLSGVVIEPSIDPSAPKEVTVTGLRVAQWNFYQ